MLLCRREKAVKIKVEPFRMARQVGHACSGNQDGVQVNITGTFRCISTFVSCGKSGPFGTFVSQACQFWTSHTMTEQAHIAAAYVFEFSKIQHEWIRLRMLANLMNVHDDLANAVATGLCVNDMPDASAPARDPVDLDAYDALYIIRDALNIIRNAPDSFAGRELDVFLCTGADASLLTTLEDAFGEEGAMVIAPHIEGAQDGSVANFHLMQKMRRLPLDHAARLAKMANGHPCPSCPFLIMCAVSIPSNVADAEPNDLNPIIGLVRLFTPRWSCSRMLFRYFDR